MSGNGLTTRGTVSLQEAWRYSALEVCPSLAWAPTCTAGSCACWATCRHCWGAAPEASVAQHGGEGRCRRDVVRGHRIDRAAVEGGTQALRVPPDASCYHMRGGGHLAIQREEILHPSQDDRGRRVRYHL